MVGGNPQHDKYGFRYWKTPGAFAEYVTTGSLGKFEGFLAALWKAAYVCSLHIQPHSYAVTDFLKFHYCRARIYCNDGWRSSPPSKEPQESL